MYEVRQRAEVSQLWCASLCGGSVETQGLAKTTMKDSSIVGFQLSLANIVIVCTFYLYFLKSNRNQILPLNESSCICNV